MGRAGLSLVMLIVVFLVPRLLEAQGTTFIVNSVGDFYDGSCAVSHCTLREAITAANANPGTDTIAFNLPGAGPHLIQPAQPLPLIETPVTIDGTTQPGYAGSPVIVLNGDLVPPAPPGQEPTRVGINITGENSMVRGLVINGWDYGGIGMIFGGGNVITGNYIGTNASGSAAVPNLYGIIIYESSNNVIGGTATGAGNLISGNLDDGVNIGGPTARNNRVLGNIIGLDVTGNAALGNGDDGVKIEDTRDSFVGGTTLGSRNLIAANTNNGVVVKGATTGTKITGNHIGNNGELGIDLGSDGVTLNDISDADTGPNQMQNFPVITGAQTTGTSLMLDGTLNARPGTIYRLEYFRSETCDSSQHGEGEVYLGAASVTTGAAGTGVIRHTLAVSLLSGAIVTATTTDPGGNTSEFSACVTVTDVSNAALIRNYFATRTPTLTWSAVNWAVQYQIQVDDDALFRSPNLDVTLPGNILSYTPSLAQALADGVYFWRVRAQNANNLWGGWSAIERMVIDAP